MASFRYRAVTTAGTITSGTVDAVSEDDAVAQVRSLGHLPVTTSPAGVTWWRVLLPSAPAQRYPADAIGFVTRQLAALLGARLPLDRALAILAELGEARRLRKALTGVLAAVRDGASLADAFNSTGAFSKPYVTMIRAGEHGGNLETTLKRLAAYLAAAAAMRQTIVSAMIYPAILLCTGVLSIIFILVFVLPQFGPLFEQSGKPPPPAMRIALEAGSFLASYWWLIAVLVAAAALVLRRVSALPAYRSWRDRNLLRLPLIGDLVIKSEVERFSRTLSTLLLNGVGLPQALSLTSETLGNSVVAKAVSETAARLKEGEPLAAHLRQTGVFPQLALDMLRVGEETGSLEEMLLQQAELYEREVRHSVDRLLALLVPVMTVLMGLAVAGLIASILVAILSVNDLAA
jgi:general secretion pathway protein F